jgi:predicted aspartyl protease
MSATNLIPEQDAMGRVLTEAKIENLRDLWAVEEGRAAPESVRSLLLTDALVDTGATTLALPIRFIRQLGLSKKREQRAISVRGPAAINIYEVVQLTILGRNCAVEVMEVPDEVPALIGQIPLEMLDLVIDLQGRRLTGNPAHGGEHTLELY